MTKKKKSTSATNSARSRDDFLIYPNNIKNNGIEPELKKKKPPKITLASTADKLNLYESSVQEPTKECRNIEAMYKDLGGPCPRILREDFCSSARIAMAWLHSPDPLRMAIGVDIDPYMIKRAQDIKERESISQLQLIQASVLNEHDAPQADIICALNYAIFYFHKRSDALRYLQLSKTRLKPNGCLILDLFGGSSLSRAGKKKIRTNTLGVEYWLEESKQDIWSNTVKLALSFRMKDGSWVKNAFTYDFRVYSISEVLEMLQETGYTRTTVYINEIGKKEDMNDSEDEGYDIASESVSDDDKPTSSWDQYTRLKSGERFYVETPFNAYIVACPN